MDFGLGFSNVKKQMSQLCTKARKEKLKMLNFVARREARVSYFTFKKKKPNKQPQTK